MVSEPPKPAGGEPRKRSFWHRRRWLLVGLGAVVGLGVILAVVLIVFVSSTQPAKPGKFYAAPSPLPGGPPGTVIRSEVVEDPPEGSMGWKILYLSRSYTGEPTAMSGLLFVPTTDPPAGGRDVVAVTHGTSGVASNCAVSTLGAVYWPLIDGFADFMEAGYAVVVPDYQGLGTPGPHPYLVGESEAWSTLDAVRAAHLFAPADAGTRFVVWGASQGGHAALFTGEEAASYAPDLTLVGVAAAAPATDLRALFELNRNTTFGRVLSAYTVAMWSRVYPQLRFDQLVTPVARPVVTGLAKICIVSESGILAAGIVGEALKITYLHELPWETEPWKGLLARNTPGRGRIPAPIMITQGEADPLVRPAVTAAFVEELCRQGDTVAYVTYPEIGHFPIGPEAAPDVAEWIGARFAGEPAPTVCS